MILIIAGLDFELLSEAKKIAQTKQVNDLNNINLKQTNFTNTYTIPPTAKNIRNLQYLGVIGNNSNMPYQKNVCYLFDDNGVCFIYKGLANIVETITKEIKCYIYDGNIDLYKEIDNKNMSDLDLTDITHFRTLTTIADSINNNLPYKYIIADYNGGATVIGNPVINADYLIPSVKVSWIWEKIFDKFGFTFTGAKFEAEDFQDLWLTYPKGTTVGLDVTTPLLDVTSSTAIYSFGQSIAPIDINTYLLTAGQIQLFQSKEYYISPAEGQIKVTYEGFKFENTYVDGGQGQELNINTFTAKLVVENRTKQEQYLIDWNTSLFIPVDIGDEIYFFVSTPYIYSQGGWPDYVTGDGQFRLDLYEGEKIDFKKAFENLLIKDFINEVLWISALTPFKDKYTKNYDFLTYDEWILSNNVIDWSKKYNSTISEKYVYGSYAQLNYMRHKYNADNANYNDAAFAIENTNLKDSTDVIRSNFYTTEFEKDVEIAGRKLNKYKLWDKEVKEGNPPVVSYKALDNRFYFIKYSNVELESPITIESESLGSSETFESLPFERNTGLTFKEIKNNSYKRLGYLLNKTKFSTVEMDLNNRDISELDFRKKIYIEQLGGQFILNKVINYMEGIKTKVELLKINQSDLINVEIIGDGNPAPTLLSMDHVYNVTIPEEYNIDITDILYLGISLGTGDSIAQIEFQSYAGNLFAVAGGGDILYNDGVLQFGDNLVLHTLNIDNLYDYTNTPRTFTYIYHVYIFNSITGLTTHRYSVIKNFTINYSEEWGRVLAYSPSNSAPAYIPMDDNFALNAPLRENEVYSHIIPRDFGWEYGPLSEFWGKNVQALELDVQAEFYAPLNLEPRKVDLSFYPAPGYVEGLQISYELYAYNTVTMTYRLIYNNCSLQVTLTYIA